MQLASNNTSELFKFVQLTLAKALAATVQLHTELIMNDLQRRLSANGSMPLLGQ